MSKLLLVEDNPTDEKLTVRVFDKCGVGIVVARDGAEALDYLFGVGPGLAHGAPVSPAVVLR
jgi:CheY-like chemotaxis protein